MAKSHIQVSSLVLYKGRPARVASVDRKKLTIVTQQGDAISVRPKDVGLLHPGPIAGLEELTPQEGEVKVAWELLRGQTTTLPELADLVYGDYRPATAWAAWQLVDDALYFRGDLVAVSACTAEEVAEALAAREAKRIEREAWEAFVARVDAGESVPADDRFLADVADLAIGRRDQSRVLRDLGRAETPENAHALLLQIGAWDETMNPYPDRLGLALAPPMASLRPLPDDARLDLTHLVALAIDDAGSTDADDALSLEGDRLWVHVADVAALVSPDGEADLEARARASNLYLPEGTVHMLPEAATDRLALGRQEISPALSFAITLDDSGEPADLAVHPSWVRVTRLTYDEAEARLNEPLLASLLAIAERHQRLRLARGAIEIDLPEVKVRVEDGEVTLTPLPALRSRLLVQEAMLIAGQAVAAFAQAHNIPIAYSVQDAPADLDVPDGLAGMLARRKRLRRSQRTGEPGPHAGMGLPAYVQATSPLRRYLDLVAHQQLRAWTLGQPLLDRSAVVARVGAAEAVTGALRATERLSNAHWTLVYLRQQPEWQGEGIVVDQNGARSSILIPDLAWEFSAYLRENVALNDRLLCRIESVNLPLLEAQFDTRPV